MLSRRNREPPPSRTELTSFAAKARDLGALRDAVVDAASVGTGLWLSYLFVLFYFAIAVGAVTHRDLFLENPVRLPFLNVELPLKAFFVLGPLVFVVVHAYVLLHFVLLAGKIGAFDVELEAQIGGDDVKARLRRQLPSNIFVQSLAGPHEERTGTIFLLRLIGQISLVAGPIALLVLFQLQFLPYHNEPITMWQRAAVVIDLGLLWILWPPIERGETARLRWSDFRQVKVQALLLVSILPVLLVFTIATFPGEWLEENLPPVRLVPTAWPKLSPESAQGDKVPSQNQSPKAAPENQPPKTPVAGLTLLDTSNKIITTVLALMKLGSLDELLAASFPDYVPLKKAVTAALASTEPSSLHELLVAGNVNLVTDSPKSLWSNVLALSDFKAGDRVKFDAEGKIAIGSDALSLRGRDLRGAVFARAHLDKADFTGAQLQNAVLAFAELREAKFNCDRDGKQRRCAQLPGADLIGAQLPGADLSGAELQGADLGFAQLPGAGLYGAQLQGADLDGAQLQGAYLTLAQLQGADFGGAQLKGAEIQHTLVWRAKPPAKDATKDVWGSPDTGAKSLGFGCKSAEAFCGWTPASFAALRTIIETELPAGRYRDAALERIAVLEKPPDPADHATADAWGPLYDPSLTRPQYLAALAAMLQRELCAAESSPDAIAGVIRQLDYRFQDDTRQEAELAKAFLDDKKCSAAPGLSEEAKAKLRAIRDRAAEASAIR